VLASGGRFRHRAKRFVDESFSVIPETVIRVLQRVDRDRVARRESHHHPAPVCSPHLVATHIGCHVDADDLA
jgi:hypothetical protein